MIGDTYTLDLKNDAYARAALAQMALLLIRDGEQPATVANIVEKLGFDRKSLKLFRMWDGMLVAAQSPEQVATRFTGAVVKTLDFDPVFTPVLLEAAANAGPIVEVLPYAVAWSEPT